MPKNSRSSGRNSPSVRRNQEPLVAAQGEHVSARFGRGDFGSTLWFAGLTCAFIAYFCWYLSQPSFFAAAFAFPLPPPALAGESPKAASDPEKTDAMNVGSKSKIF